jgi:hypothetical protein
MSLDVYLEYGSRPQAGSGIFVRENGSVRETTAEEWDARFPGQEPFMVMRQGETSCVYSANITHNLNKMAMAADIYKHLWAPEEIGITVAAQLIAPLSEGLARLKADPKHFKKFNPSNKWGDYEGLVKFVENYLAACKEDPDATVRVWA